MRNLNVPLNCPSRKYEGNSELLRDIEFLVQNGPYLNGSNIEYFERGFSEYLDINHCVAVSSGTSALELSLLILELPKFSNVVVCANAGGYSSSAIIRGNLFPNYCDIDQNGLMTLENLKKSINSETRAVIITHLYGQSGEIVAISEFCRDRNLPLIEDCAQSAGAMLGGKKIGTFGDLGAFSFYPTKNLSTIGDGGAVVTDSLALAQKCVRARQYGWVSKYVSTFASGNFRMDEFHGLILRRNLSTLDRLNIKRREIWRLYQDSIKSKEISIIGEDSDGFVAHLAVLKSKFRNEIADIFTKNAVEIGIHYPIPDYEQEPFRKFKVRDYPETDKFINEILTIPLFPEMLENEIELVCSILEKL